MNSVLEMCGYGRWMWCVAQKRYFRDPDVLTVIPLASLSIPCDWDGLLVFRLYLNLR